MHTGTYETTICLTWYEKEYAHAQVIAATFDYIYIYICVTDIIDINVDSYSPNPLLCCLMFIFIGVDLPASHRKLSLAYTVGRCTAPLVVA